MNKTFNPFPNKPWFLHVYSTSLLKTLWEKEKLLVTSNFSFSHSVFFQSREFSAIFIKFEIVVSKLFQFGRVRNLLFGKGLRMVLWLLTHYQTTNFRLFQSERVCRRQFQIWRNGRKLYKWIENIVGKGEIAHYEQFLLFPQCFKKACFPGASKGVIVWEWVKLLNWWKRQQSV